MSRLIFPLFIFSQRSLQYKTIANKYIQTLLGQHDIGPVGSLAGSFKCCAREEEHIGSLYKKAVMIWNSIDDNLILNSAIRQQYLCVCVSEESWSRMHSSFLHIGVNLSLEVAGEKTNVISKERQFDFSFDVTSSRVPAFGEPGMTNVTNKQLRT